MAENLLTVILVVLVTARLTRLITADRITQFLRNWATGKGPLEYLIGSHEYPGCDWCASMYIGPAAAASAWFWGGEGWWMVAAGGVAASYVTGWLAALEPDKE